MNAAKACLFAGVLLVPVFFANAQNATLHPDRDAFICDCQGNANNPGGPLTKLYQGPYYTGGHQCYARTVLHWALTGLPQTGNILSATLQMKCTARYGTLTGRMAFYRIVEDWGATTVTYNSMPRHTSQDSILADWPAVNQWLSVDVTQLVRFFVAHPDSNFGIYGHSANTAGGTGAVELNSSRFSDSLGWPVLAIQFEPNGVRMGSSQIPSGFRLEAFPNPFNPTTSISYSLAKSGWVSIDVVDINGRIAERLVNGPQTAGEHRVQWDAARFSSGIYLVTLTSGNARLTHKLCLLR